MAQRWLAWAEGPLEALVARPAEELVEIGAAGLAAYTEKRRVVQMLAMLLLLSTGGGDGDVEDDVVV